GKGTCPISGVQVATASSFTKLTRSLLLDDPSCDSSPLNPSAPGPPVSRWHPLPTMRTVAGHCAGLRRESVVAPRFGASKPFLRIFSDRYVVLVTGCAVTQSPYAQACFETHERLTRSDIAQARARFSCRLISGGLAQIGTARADQSRAQV